MLSHLLNLSKYSRHELEKDTGHLLVGWEFYLWSFDSVTTPSGYAFNGGHCPGKEVT